MSQKRDEPDAPKLTLTFSGAGREIQRKSSKRSSKRDKRSRREVEETEQPVGLALDADAAALAASEGAESELLDIPTPAGLDVTAGFTPMQLRRYEKFRRSAFSRAKLKRLVQDTSGQSSCSDKVAIVVQAVAKTLVGELVEKGRDVMLEWGDVGPLRARHVQEAHRRLRAQGSILQYRTARTFIR